MSKVVHRFDCPKLAGGQCACGADKVAATMITHRRQRRMEVVDALPQELRELVHEYGFYVVKSFIDIGVTKPKHIRHLVEAVLNEFSPTRGSNSSQGTSPAKVLRMTEEWAKKTTPAAPCLSPSPDTGGRPT